MIKDKKKCSECDSTETVKTRISEGDSRVQVKQKGNCRN